MTVTANALIESRGRGSSSAGDTNVVSPCICHRQTGDQDQKLLSDMSSTACLLDGDSATIRNFVQNDTNRSKNDKSAVEAPRSS